MHLNRICEVNQFRSKLCRRHCRLGIKQSWPRSRSLPAVLPTGLLPVPIAAHTQGLSVPVPPALLESYTCPLSRWLVPPLSFPGSLWEHLLLGAAQGGKALAPLCSSIACLQRAGVKIKRHSEVPCIVTCTEKLACCLPLLAPRGQPRLPGEEGRVTRLGGSLAGMSTGSGGLPDTVPTFHTSSSAPYLARHFSSAAQRRE